MKTTIKLVTPQWAAQILETRNVQNRHMSERVVDKYANDMATGSWCLTHQGIAFDVNGDLLDGQHRLAAVVKSKRSIEMLVTTGIPSVFKNGEASTSVFATIDGLKPRTNATTLELLSYKNSKLVASIARCSTMIVTGGGRNQAACISGPTTVEIVNLFKGSVERIASLSTGAGIVRIRASALSAIAFWHTTDPNAAESFLVEVKTVAGGKKTPSRAFASWVSNYKGTSGGTAQVDLLFVAASAIHHHVKGSSVEKLYGSDESVKWLASTNRPLASKILSLFKL